MTSCRCTGWTYVDRDTAECSTRNPSDFYDTRVLLSNGAHSLLAVLASPYSSSELVVVGLKKCDCRSR